MSDFRVLLLYPNGLLMNPPPISTGIFTALLKQNGFTVDLFDSTLYPEKSGKSSDAAKQETLQVRPFDYGSRNIKLKESNLEDDLRRKIETFRPDLISISVLECTYQIMLRMLSVAREFDIPILVGGVFATFSPEIVLDLEGVDFVCVGEGEGALIDVCQRLAAGEEPDDVKNLWLKKDGRIIKNPVREPVNLDLLPIPDYSLFAPERFYRPMAGKVYKTIPIETSRGCPYLCTFCNSPSMAELYRKEKFKYFRKKSMPVIIKELDYLIKKWGAEYVYFASDTFLTMTDAEFDQFIDYYKNIKLPFWMQSRVEAITAEKINKLKEVGCHRMSIGLEHGNADFRKNVLKKYFSNEAMVKASKIIAEAGIPLTVNNIIGFPDETRELIFDTIELNRQLTYDTVNAVPFAPFHGTSLHKLCLEKGYIEEDYNPGSLNVDVPLDMPSLSKDEIRGLKRTFALYARLPQKYWPQIKKAENFDDEGNRIYQELSNIYKNEYFNEQKGGE